MGTYIKLTKIAKADVISIILAFTSKSRLIKRCTANQTSMAVMTQIITTEAMAPITSARYQPKDMLQEREKKRRIK